MKQKVEKALNDPKLTMLEVEALYQELASKQGKRSFMDFVRKLIGESEDELEMVQAVNDIQDILDDLKSELHDQRDKRINNDLEELC